MNYVDDLLCELAEVEFYDDVIFLLPVLYAYIILL